MSLRHLLAASLVLCPAATLVAQQAGNRDDFAQPRTTRAQKENTDNGRTATDRNDHATGERTARAASAQTQQFIRDCLIGENQAEVALARIAEQRASSREVKDFAQMMIKDHTQLISQLEKLQGGSAEGSRSAEPKTEGAGASSGTDGNANNDPPRLRDPQPQGNERSAGGSERGTEQSNNARSASATAASYSASGPLQELMTIKKEIGDRCLASAKQEMEKKAGADFDKCYMAAQAIAHQHMLDSLMVFQNHTSSDLQQLITKASQSTEKHLDHAKEIVKNLDKSGKSASTARRDTETDKE